MSKDIFTPMTYEQFRFHQRVWQDYAWWNRRGYHNWAYEQKLTALSDAFGTLRTLLFQEDTDTALERLRELCQCADVDAVNARSFRARVIEYADLFTPEEVEVAKAVLQAFNEDAS